MSDTPDDAVRHRLAVYGTLAPGRPNEHVLAGVEGTWATGTVRGHLHASGWGAAQGYPGLVLDSTGPEVPVHVLTSDHLPAHWDRLDEFEGPGYERVEVEVRPDDGDGGGVPLRAYLYALAPGAVPPEIPSAGH